MTRGRFLAKEEWHSICSAHRQYDENCERCNVGTWGNVWMNKVSGAVFKIAPKLWIWWVNRKPMKAKFFDNFTKLK